MRRLGLDIGEKRVGVAVSDPSGRVSTPLKVLEASSLAGEATALRRLVEDYEVAEIVVGLPLTLAGDEGPQAARVRGEAERLARVLGLPLVMWDERMSSKAAQRVMGEAGEDSRARRGKVDMVAASLLLQSYLDSRLSPRQEGGR
jgi:putative Holliday junction resolvase